MAVVIDPYDRFILALKHGRIAKPTTALTRNQIVHYRTSLLERIIRQAAHVDDFSALYLEGLNLETILEQVQKHSAPYLGPVAQTEFNMPKRIALPLVIQGIYRDIDTYSRRPILAEQEINETWIQFFGQYRKLPLWYQTALSRLGRPLLGYLIRSRTFLCACMDLKKAEYETLLEILEENSTSLLVFARVRLPRIKDVDAKTGAEMPDKLAGITMHKDPHWYVVPSSGQSIKPTFVDTIQNNIYNPKNFRGISKPSAWPSFLPWPSHPGIRHPGSKCFICKSTTHCTCTPPLAASGEILLELYNYGGALGRGVRALQKIRVGTIVGEYVGVFHHVTANIDTTYAMFFDNSGPAGDEDDSPTALLDASTQGNWTRFINHVCADANVRFVTANVGLYRRIIIVANRDIMLFEQLTVDYGPDYWVDRTCLCGCDGCYAPPLAAAKVSNTASGLESQGLKRKAAWLMDEQYHSEDSDYADTHLALPKGTPAAKRSKRAAKGGAKASASVAARATVQIQEIDEEMTKRKREARERVAAAREEKDSVTIWRKRWIGHENAERPRRKGKKIGGPFFAHF